MLLKQEANKILSFKDPAGCALFRQTLEKLEVDMKFLVNDKEAQYKAMRQSLRLIEDIDVENRIKGAEAVDEQVKRDKIITNLKSKQNEL